MHAAMRPPAPPPQQHHTTPLSTHLVDHLPPAVPGWHLLEQVEAAVEEAGARGAAHLVARRRQKVAAQVLHVHLHARGEGGGRGMSWLYIERERGIREREPGVACLLSGGCTTPHTHDTTSPVSIYQEIARPLFSSPLPPPPSCAAPTGRRPPAPPPPARARPPPPP